MADKEQVTVLAGTHSFLMDTDGLKDYGHVLPHDSDPHYGVAQGASGVGESDTQAELRRISHETLSWHDTKQVLPVVHPDETVSLRVKQYLSPFERSNRSQIPTAEESGRGQDVRSFRLALKADHAGHDAFILPLVCSEALQYVKQDLSEVTTLCILSHHQRPRDFDNLINHCKTNGIPSVLANDGRYGGSGVFLTPDDRAENWWFGGDMRGSLPPGDAILVFEIDPSRTVPELARANPRFPSGVAALASIVPATRSEASYHVSIELNGIGEQFRCEYGAKEGEWAGVDYGALSKRIDWLVDSRQATSVQALKLRRLQDLARLKNLDDRAVEAFCNDCIFDIDDA